MMRNKSILILEIIWLATGVLSIVASIRIATTTGGNRVWLFAVMALISFLFAWFRHKQRKNS